MPIFEFHCQKCQGDFEKIVLNNSSPVKCPRCQSSKVRKKMSAFSITTGSKSSSPVAASHSGRGCGSCSSHHCSTCH